VVSIASSPCHLTINEVASRGVSAATDEFVEIYNSCTAPFDASGFVLKYRSASATSTESVLFTFPASTSIPANGYFLLTSATTTYTGTSDGKLTSGIADGASLVLRNASAALVDQVGFGAVLNTSFEGALAASPATGGTSLARATDGLDTDNNSLDFKITKTPTPRAKNVITP
jgi:hypothetical protein